MGSSFVWKLTCPVCGKTGEADIKEPNDHAWSRGARGMRIRSLSPQFLEDGADDDGEATFACVDHPGVKAKVGS